MLKKTILELSRMICERREEQKILRDEQKYLPSCTQLANERKIIKLHKEEEILKFCKNTIILIRVTLLSLKI